MCTDTTILYTCGHITCKAAPCPSQVLRPLTVPRRCQACTEASGSSATAKGEAAALKGESLSTIKDDYEFVYSDDDAASHPDPAKGALEKANEDAKYARYMVIYRDWVRRDRLVLNWLDEIEKAKAPGIGGVVEGERERLCGLSSRGKKPSVWKQLR